MPDDTEDEAQGNYADELRKQAAILAGLADSFAWQAETLQRMADESGPMFAALGLDSPAGMAAKTRARAENARLVGQIQAAQALAYQDMMDAGGPDNPEAYADYVQTTERHTALIPLTAGGDHE